MKNPSRPVPVKGKSPEFLFDLAEHLTDRLTRQGKLSSDQSADLAWESAEYMATHWGGINIYFPKGTRIHQSRRARKVWQEFNGKNHEDLARKYKFSTQWIYHLVKKMQEEENKLHQGSLFDTSKQPSPKQS